MKIKRKSVLILAIVTACIAIIAVMTLCEARRSHRMHEALELALEQNRSGIPFTSDTIVLATDTTQLIPLRRVVSYYKHPLRRFFSRHSSFFTRHSSFIRSAQSDASHLKNPQSSHVQSLYALGCVYRDLHEAPVALLTWEDAIAAADTTSADCDYATLFRVYGQMADIYRDQHLPEKQLEANSCFCKYALLAGDTLFYLRGKLLCNSVYYTLGDSAAIFANSEAVRQQYLQFGLTQEAARVYPTPIQIAVEAAQYKRAHKMMDRYELESGLFGADGFITDSSRAQYHSYKGHYYLGIHEVDSAERQFRHILPIPSTAISAYRGLMAVYKEKRNIDSVQKYSSLFEAQAIDIMNQSNNTAIIQAEGMYDYSRQEQIAQNEEKKAGRRTVALIVSLLIIALILIYFFYDKKKENLQKRVRALEYSKIADSYHATIEKLEETQNDIAILQQEVTKNKATKDLLTKKEEQVRELKKLITDLSRQLKYSPRHELQSEIKEAEIIERLHRICKAHFEDHGKGLQSIPPRKASDHEWDLLTKHTRLTHPKFYLFVNEHKLSDLEYKVCLLVRYHFKNPEITTLTGANKRSISNVRKTLAQVLFDLNSAHELDKHLAE